MARSNNNLSSLVLVVVVLASSSSLSVLGVPRSPPPQNGPLQDPISTTPPNFPGGTIANDAPPSSSFFQDFRPPYPTSSWWSGFTVGNQDAVAAGPFPYQTATLGEGLMFGLSDSRRFDGTSIHVSTQRDWIASISGLENKKDNRKATHYDTQVVCLKYFNNAGAEMETCLVPGSPYITLTFRNAQATFTSGMGDITSFQWVDQGKKGKVSTSGGGTYLIYVVSGDQLQITQDTKKLTSQNGFNGVVRFAKLKDPSHESILDNHVGTIPVKLDMSFVVNGDTSRQTWTWTTTGTGAPDNLLMMSWPHHRRVLQNPQYVNGIQILTLKGMMKGVRGNVWVQEHALPTITWFAKNSPHSSCMGELKKTLEAEVKALKLDIPGDFYFWGGAFARASRLALIAEHIGEQGLIPRVVDELKQSVAYWFRGDRSPSAAYETGWGGVINKDGWNNSWIDFGNAYYNDHHFHYGYLLYGAAVIGKYDPNWLNTNKEFFIHIARNIGNPSPADPHYTVTRHMDFFAGHSWASGIHNGAGPRDQESSGEAINGYYGLLMFAHAIQNQPLIDYSRMLLAMEIAGAREYWHLYPNSNDPEQPYPEQDFRALTTVGNVMDTQAGAWLFWGAERTQIAAIQMLPLTPIGVYIYDREWMVGALDYCMGELEDPKIGDQFKSVIYAAYSNVDPIRAYGFSSGLFDWGSGNSASNQLYFVSTQDSNSDICSSALQTPEGLYNIQEINTGLYITVRSGGQLAATTNTDVLGEKFLLEFTPGGGVIKSTSNLKYVTASPDGLQPLSAARDEAKGYETFRWKQVEPNVYILTAMVNRMDVSSTNEGVLYNNANATNGNTASRFRLVETQASNINLPGTIKLKSSATGKYVVATAADNTLRCVASQGSEQGTDFIVEKVQDDQYTLKSAANNMYVTGNQDGTVKLSASAGQAQAWEYFRFVSYQGNYIIVHVASGKVVQLQDDDTLMDNAGGVDGSNRGVWGLN